MSDGLSGTMAYADVLPGLTAEEREWLWADACGADAGELLIKLGRARTAIRAFLVAHDSGRSVREEMAALREVVG